MGENELFMHPDLTRFWTHGRTSTELTLSQRFVILCGPRDGALDTPCLLSFPPRAHELGPEISLIQASPSGQRPVLLPSCHGTNGDKESP